MFIQTNVLQFTPNEILSNIVSFTPPSLINSGGVELRHQLKHNVRIFPSVPEPGNKQMTRGVSNVCNISEV